MQQRRVRLGDILDDYCPRERRITNHAVVAMIEDEVKQTRCATCDADHEYKHARIPPQRRKKSDDAPPEATEAALRPRPADEAAPGEVPEAAGAGSAETPVHDDSAEPGSEPVAAGADDDGPVHRRLIRATLPRPDGQLPERKEPDFTIRQPGMRGRGFDGHKDGHQHGRRPMRAHDDSQPFGAPRHGSGQVPRHGGSGHGSRHGAGGSGQGGNRPGHPAAPRGNRPGAGRGGRKRGR